MPDIYIVIERARIDAKAHLIAYLSQACQVLYP